MPPRNYQQSANTMNTATLILAILNSQDASGYEIKKASAEGRFSYFVDISFGSIYPTLSRLEAQGLVTCREEAQSGKPDRKIYAITEKGRAELIAGLSQLPQPDKFKSEYLLVAANSELAGSTAVAAATTARIERLEQEVHMLTGFLEDCDNPASKWVINYGLHVMQADLAYLKNHRKQIEAIAAQGDPVREAAE